jgi:hypothetical protein
MLHRFPQLFVTSFACACASDDVALIGDGLESPTLDEDRPQLNCNETGAHQYHGSQDHNPDGDDNGLRSASVVSLRSWTDDIRHRAFVTRLRDQAKLSQQIAYPCIGRTCGTDCGRLSLAVRL